MATNITGSFPTDQFGAKGSAGGIAEPTGSDFEASLGTMVPAKDHLGEVQGFLLGKAKATLRVEGYVSAFEAPALNGDIQVGGYSGSIVRSSMRATNEDFAKGSAEGIAIL
jgi:hypothetical protein